MQQESDTDGRKVHHNISALDKVFGNSKAFFRINVIILNKKVIYTNTQTGNECMLTKSLTRQLCLIRTDVDPKFLSALDKIRSMRIGIICIGTDLDLIQSVRFRRKSGLHMSGLSRVACISTV